MKPVKFEENELMVMAIFAEKTRQDTVITLKEALEVLEETGIFTIISSMPSNVISPYVQQKILIQREPTRLSRFLANVSLREKLVPAPGTSWNAIWK